MRFPSILAVVLALLTVAALAAAPGDTAPAIRSIARRVSPDATAENSQRKLAVSPSGALLLLYVRPVAGVNRIALAESTDGGRSWTSTEVSPAASTARLPSLALFPDGALHVVWTDFGLKGRVLHRVRRGGRWTEPASLSVPGVYAGVPVVAPRGNQPHVLWYGIVPEQPQVPTRHGAVYQILATRQEGRAWTRPVVISAGVPDSLNPSLAADARGVLHAAWFQLDGHAYRVRYRQFTREWAEPRWLTGAEVDRTNVALEADGTAVHLVWEERGARRRIIYLALGRAPVALAAGAVADPVVTAAGGRVAAAWSSGTDIVVRSLRPAGPARVIGAGMAPMIALRGATADVAWTTTGPVPELRFAAVPMP